MLENCDSTLHTTVSLGFTGDGDANGVLQSNGTAIGVGFKVTDGADVPVPFDGTFMAPITITDGTMTLPFKADYISTAGTQSPGSITSSATFKMSYL
ncbi:Type-1 fimbrial protein, A chain precursor [compost metagenome]